MKPPKCKLCGKEEWRHVCAATAFPLTRVKLGGETVIIAGASKLTISGAFPVTKQKTVTQTVTRGGRGKKVHASPADKQKAYRDRKKAKA